MSSVNAINSDHIIANSDIKNTDADATHFTERDSVNAVKI